MVKMNDGVCGEILKRHGVRPTSNRIIIYRELIAEEHPSSMSELETRIMTIDKSGIFRTLTLFKEHHLVHVIEDGDGETKYEPCYRSNADGDADDDEHVHFFCENCHKTFCLYDTPVPDVSIPHGYIVSSTNFVIKGLCQECAAKLSLKRRG